MSQPQPLSRSGRYRLTESVYDPAHNPWEIAPNLWGGIVGEPGSKKSPAMGLVFKAIDRLKIGEAEAFEKGQETYKKAMADHSSEVKL